MLKFHVGDPVKITRKNWNHLKIGVIKYTIPQHFVSTYRGKRLVPREYFVLTKDGTLHSMTAQEIELITPKTIAKKLITEKPIVVKRYRSPDYPYNIWEVTRHPDGSLSCNCPDWRYRRAATNGKCKHILDYTAVKTVYR